MTELREGAYRFSSRARGQSEARFIEELIDPDGDTVPNLAEEGDQGAMALGQSLELITFDTHWLFGQIGDREALDLKAEEHWEVSGFTFRRVDRRDDAAASRRPLAADGRRSAHLAHRLLQRRSFSRSRRVRVRRAAAAHGLGRDAQDGHRDRDASAASTKRARRHSRPRRTASATRSIDLSPSTTSGCTPCRLGQWMSMDFANLAKLWNEEPVEKLIAELREKGPRLGPQNAQIVELKSRPRSRRPSKTRRSRKPN